MAGACAVLATAAPMADADQSVVSATIYPGAQGSVAAKSATLSQLQTCALYSGPNPLYLYPGDQPFQAPADSTWTLDEVLQCGLGIAPSQLSGVQVGSATRGYEAPLTLAALTDATQYQDPAAAGALPIISSDGTEDQNTYVRPWRGGSDANAADRVVQTGTPITLLVYLNGSLLTVSASQHPVSHTATTRSIGLAATVRDASGATVPSSALSWSWDFADGTTSTAPSPTHRFGAGTYYVTVQVTDTATGSGGTATLQVSVNSGSQTGPSNHNGNPKRNRSKNPSGFDHGNHAPTGRGHRQPTSTSPATNQTQATTTTTSTTSTTETTTASTTTSPSVSTTTTTTSTAAHTTTTTRAHRRAATRTRTRHQPTVPPGAPLVTGQLIADVNPLPAGASPLVHLASAAATPVAEVRQASRLSAVPAIGGALAVGLLLALGAERELRGRRRWRLTDHDR